MRHVVKTIRGLVQTKGLVPTKGPSYRHLQGSCHPSKAPAEGTWALISGPLFHSLSLSHSLTTHPLTSHHLIGGGEGSSGRRDPAPLSWTHW